MKRLIKRLLLFILAIPAIIGLVYFLPFLRHLPLNIVVIIFSALGAVEFSAMLEKKLIRIPRIEAFILGALAPAVLTLTLSFNCPGWMIPLLSMAGVSWVLLSRIFSRTEKMETIINYLAVGFSVLIYPGFFMYWLVKMSVWENSGLLILIFLFITLGSDAAAWLAGTLWGASNRGKIPASPNKSIAGYMGGVAGSIIVSGGAALIIPGAFIVRTDCLPVFVTVIILGLCTGIAAALGDLSESAIKRSCGFKDSGNLMPGRGGVLDSIDSIAVAAPVFYLLFNTFFAN